MAYRCAGVLAERKLSFGCDFGVSEHRQSYELVVLTCFGIAEYLCNHCVMLAAEHESVVVSSLTGKHCQRLGIDDKKFVSPPVLYFDIVRGKMIVFGRIGAERKHLLIFERFCSHNF